ncbi:MAG: hypothetical protein KC731_27475 [Myxococcales bacterium]|nr:hypothetical protein [Myxococcales bacterium]
MTVTLTPSARGGHVVVTMRGLPRGACWTLPHGARRNGAVEPRCSLAALAYEVAPSPDAPCPFEVTPDHAVFCGDAVLARPDDDQPRLLHLALRGEEGFHAGAASSFGLAQDLELTATPSDLAQAGFLFGDLHHARFDAPEGRDHAAWRGYFAFDPRWIAAEAAGLRTAVDQWLGIRRPSEDPPVGLLLSSRADPSPVVQLHPLFRGALLTASPSSAWDLSARLTLTSHWVRRTLGGSLRLALTGARWWLDEGVARAVALTVLQRLALATPEEVAGEVNGWLGATALSPHRGLSLEALSRLAEEDVEAGAEARRLLVARGALLGLSYGGEGARALQRELRRLVADLAAGRAPALAVDRERPDLWEAFVSGAPLVPRASDVDPCLQPTRLRYHRFDLGWARAGDRVATVDPRGPAARAGVEAEDRIVTLDYAEGDSGSPVSMRVRRGEREVALRYLPRGKAALSPALATGPACDG